MQYLQILFFNSFSIKSMTIIRKRRSKTSAENASICLENNMKRLIIDYAIYRSAGSDCHMAYDFLS